MSRKNTEQSSTGYPQEVHEVPTIAKSAWLPPRLKYHFFQIDKSAVYPSELYRPDFIWRAGAKIKSAYNVEPVHNVSEFVTKMFASIHRVLVPGASLRDFELSEESTTSSLSANFGILKITNNNIKPSWLNDAKNTEDQTAIDIGPLLNGFSFLRQVDEKNSFFNFSLVSSNHAHNLPVAFAFYAFTNAMKYPMKYQLKGEAGKYKRIVINFDYHIDTGKKGKPEDDQLGKQIMSASWGSALFYNKLHGRAEFDFIADLYISIGNYGERTVTYGTPKTGGSEQIIKPVMKFNYDSVRTETKYEAAFQKYVSSNEDMELLISHFSLADIRDFIAVWGEIKKQAGVNETNKALVYISWDRDIGSDGYTNWTLIGGLPLSRSDVITSICNCINLIKKDDGLVVGLDVTGMPDNLVNTRKNCVQKKILEQNLEQNLDDYVLDARASAGGYFIVHKDDKDAFPHKMNNQISKKATDYFFTMMGDISQVLRYLRDCKYLLDCTSPSGT